MSVQVDSATGRGWDLIGEAIAASGQEDASGFRRSLAAALANRDYTIVAAWLRITEDDAIVLRRRLVAEWGEP